MAPKFFATQIHQCDAALLCNNSEINVIETENFNKMWSKIYSLHSMSRHYVSPSIYKWRKTVVFVFINCNEPFTWLCALWYVVDNCSSKQIFLIRKACPICWNCRNLDWLERNNSRAFVFFLLLQNKNRKFLTFVQICFVNSSNCIIYS